MEWMRGYYRMKSQLLRHEQLITMEWTTNYYGTNAGDRSRSNEQAVGDRQGDPPEDAFASH